MHEDLYDVKDLQFSAFRLSSKIYLANHADCYGLHSSNTIANNLSFSTHVGKNC